VQQQTGQFLRSDLRIQLQHHRLEGRLANMERFGRNRRNMTRSRVDIFPIDRQYFSSRDGINMLGSPRRIGVMRQNLLTLAESSEASDFLVEELPT